MILTMHSSTTVIDIKAETFPASNSREGFICTTLTIATDRGETLEVKAFSLTPLSLTDNRR